MLDDDPVEVRPECVAMTGGLLPSQLSLSVGRLRVGGRSLAVGDVAIHAEHLTSIRVDAAVESTARYLPDRAAFAGFTGGFVRLGFDHSTSNAVHSMLVGCRTASEATALASALGDWGGCPVDGL